MLILNLEASFITENNNKDITHCVALLPVKTSGRSHVLRPLSPKPPSWVVCTRQGA